MKRHYTDEVNAQIVLALLKEHGIRKVIASPGGTNLVLVAGMQDDPFFEMYSCVDERSAAYMACGLAAESGEPVVISCTGATASRNYAPGLTEAFYRKLPVLAITSTQNIARIGHHIAQVIDRSSIQNDIANVSVTLPIINNDEDRWDCEIKVNRAILGLTHRGGGPVHINLPTTYSKSYMTQELPKVRVINRIVPTDIFPALPKGRIAIFVGSHNAMSTELVDSIDKFCAEHNAVVFCDHTSSYKGKYRILYALPTCQNSFKGSEHRPELLIHIGEVSGDYYTTKIKGQQVWRVSEDGEIRDTFRSLRCIFEMPERNFFTHYATDGKAGDDSYLQHCKNVLEEHYQKLPQLPFSNPWIASRMAHCIPDGSTIHFGILNSLRSWNFFELPHSVTSASNVGGFGIDGGLSTVMGASFANRDKLYYCVIGDLAFFYDMNSIGNRHLGRNLRIMLVNNGTGTEFKVYGHSASHLGDDVDDYVSAAGHFGNKSPTIVKHYAEDLGFEYLHASGKEEFDEASERFLTPEITERPMLFEVFTDSVLETKATEVLIRMDESMKVRTKQFAKNMLGQGNINALKKAIGRS